MPDLFRSEAGWCRFTWQTGLITLYPKQVVVIDPDVFITDGRVLSVLPRHWLGAHWDVSTVGRGDCLMLVRFMPRATNVRQAAVRLGVIVEHFHNGVELLACDTFDQAAAVRLSVRQTMARALPPSAKNPTRLWKIERE